MARKSKADAEATRQKLLDTAEILFCERGVSNTSLNHIARAAGMTRGAIYWHFHSKVDLFEALHARVRLPLEEIEAAVLGADDPLLALNRFWVRSLTEVSRDEHRRRIIAILFRKCEYVEEFETASTRMDGWIRDVVAVLTGAFAQAEEKGLLAPGVAPDTAARAVFSLVTGIVYGWMARPDMVLSEGDIEQMLTVLFDSLRIRAAA